MSADPDFAIMLQLERERIQRDAAIMREHAREHRRMLRELGEDYRRETALLRSQVREL